ncbi:MAG: phenylacetate--CoA ligase family protein, partial [Desulfonatronovibrionaceae bacterium]
ERKKNAAPSEEENLKQAISHKIRQKIFIRSEIKMVNPGELPRTFGKTKRVLDERGETD